ncbi:hypothetical protein K4A83_12235 [Spirulina subsalsa FACHB-351]|uniref:Uncharacterized protein n=1 Tax=Spirulina subsalsa FACHB-351 TaxID=234711 RepID=A0ABT3L7G1_9CYAN|nr:hypothetical protein [Spirulina subsalsa]MCW6037029.1 hypothetical protein [Spirulina subsalsa FACHB-351]
MEISKSENQGYSILAPLRRSNGFNATISDGAVTGVYDSENGEFTGQFYFSQQKAEKEIMDEDALSLEEVNDSGWV